MHIKPLIVKYWINEEDVHKILTFPWKFNLQKMLLCCLPLCDLDCDLKLLKEEELKKEMYWHELLKDSIMDFHYGWQDNSLSLKDKILKEDDVICIDLSWEGEFRFTTSAILIFDMFFNAGLSLSSEHLYITLNYLGLLPRLLVPQSSEQAMTIEPSEKCKNKLNQFLNNEDKNIKEFGEFLLCCLQCVKNNVSLNIISNY